jgi:hypothetical protein
VTLFADTANTHHRPREETVPRRKNEYIPPERRVVRASMLTCSIVSCHQSSTSGRISFSRNTSLCHCLRCLITEPSLVLLSATSGFLNQSSNATPGRGMTPLTIYRTHRVRGGILSPLYTSMHTSQRAHPERCTFPPLCATSLPVR